ncbi:unnamed protein product [Polarella glacialis]|uniref:Uncharacterized protein n=1 Tax=Polarella glacialis TaxID=89957 RepID=A0A813HJT7_POLGL|nr:unnamed protein product [Polarella glacialis]
MLSEMFQHARRQRTPGEDSSLAGSPGPEVVLTSPRQPLGRGASPPPPRGLEMLRAGKAVAGGSSGSRHPRASSSSSSKPRKLVLEDTDEDWRSASRPRSPLRGPFDYGGSRTATSWLEDCGQSQRMSAGDVRNGRGSAVPSPPKRRVLDGEFGSVAETAAQARFAESSMLESWQAETKAMSAYIQSLEAKLQALSIENGSFLQHRFADKARIAELQAQLSEALQLRSRKGVVEAQVSEARRLAQDVLAAWRALTWEACRERMRAAEAALSSARTEHAGTTGSYRTSQNRLEEAERCNVQVEAAGNAEVSQNALGLEEQLAKTEAQFVQAGPAEIRTDSKSVFDGCTVNLPVGNIVFTNVKGHAALLDFQNGVQVSEENFGNDAADALAVAGAVMHAVAPSKRPTVLQTLFLPKDVQHIMVDILPERNQHTLVEFFSPVAFFKPMEIILTTVVAMVILAGLLGGQSKEPKLNWSLDTEAKSYQATGVQSWMDYFRFCRQEMEFLWLYFCNLMQYALVQMWWTLPVVLCYRLTNGQPVHTALKVLLDIVMQAFIVKFAVAMLQFLKKFERVLKHLKVCDEKSTYMERRTMDMAGGLRDKSRVLADDIAEFKPAVGAVTWLERRCRSQFENFCKATAGACRDGAGALIQLQKMQEAVLKVIASQQPMMTNMQIQNVEFWAPLNTVELLQAIVQDKAQMLAMEMVYTSQIKERLQEVRAMMEEIKTHAGVVSQTHGDPDSVPGLFRTLFVQGMPVQINVWSRVYEENQQAS